MSSSQIQKRFARNHFTIYHLKPTNFFVTVFAKLHKSILKGKGTLKLDVNDFADLQYFRGYSKYQNIDVTVQNRWDSRVVNVSFTYRFNKGQTGQQRHSNSAGDEQSRVKAGRGN